MVVIFFEQEDIRNAQISQRKKLLLKTKSIKNLKTIFFSLSLISLFIPDRFVGVKKIIDKGEYVYEFRTS